MDELRAVVQKATADKKIMSVVAGGEVLILSFVLLSNILEKALDRISENSVAVHSQLPINPRTIIL
eukprot:scaffold10546_cov266-Chaetoceros_neogracile.AAC.1